MKNHPLLFLLTLSTALLPATETTSPGAPAPFPFAEATIEQLQTRMQAGTLTAHALTAAYLARIAALDRAGPNLNAVIEINPDALALADQLDGERAAGKVRGLLHGIPVLLKDNIATADRMETTAGSLALVGAKPLHDAALVARLRQAGAVILGKTNLSEWANFRGDRSVSGWSGRGGQTHNPYALDRSPSGSSSGSAVAVAANLCVVAIGTETAGSIIVPASTCGIVGVKPTLGLVSRTGIIPIAASFDTAGPLTRTVRDAALVLAALAGDDAAEAAIIADRPADPSGCLGPPGADAMPHALLAGLRESLKAPLPANALKGARLGYVRIAQVQPNLDQALGAALQSLRDAGAEVIEVGEFPGIDLARGQMLEVFYYEMKIGLNAYLATLGPEARMKSLADLITFNDEHWAQEQPLFGQQEFVRAQSKGPLTEPAYLNALAASRRISRCEGIDALLGRYHLDALVALANTPARLIARTEAADPIFGPHGPSGDSGCLPAALAGYPSVTVPMAEVAGLPVGLLFYGGAWTEVKLLALAADFEARTQARREPRFLPSILKIPVAK